MRGDSRGGRDVNVKLLVLMADGSRKEIPLAHGKYIIGRKTDATLRVPLASVSREHAELVVEPSQVSVRDLGSSNGTFCNNVRVEKTALAAGDVLGIGPACRFVVEIDGQSGGGKAAAGGQAMTETPPAPFPAEDEIGDLDETVTKPSPKPAASPGKRGDESSIFDFDFDFEDDENPKL